MTIHPLPAGDCREVRDERGGVVGCVIHSRHLAEHWGVESWDAWRQKDGATLTWNGRYPTPEAAAAAIGE